MAGNNVVLPLVSIIFVVVVLCGAVLVLRIGDEDAPSNTNRNISTGGSMKSVTTFCQYAEYKDSCAKSISPVAKNQSATTKDFIIAAIQATIEEVSNSYKVAADTDVDQTLDPYNHMAIEDCKEMLQDAIDDLEASLSVVGDSEIHSLNDRGDELLNWVSAVYAYQKTCTEQIEKPEYKTAIEDGMINASQLTNNVINIIADMSKVIEAFNNITKAVDLLHHAGAKAASNIAKNDSTTTTTSRRLLQATAQLDDDDDDFPSWFPAADRKLLAEQKAGKLKPTTVVAQDGSGSFKTIQEALKAYPKKRKAKYIIYVKAGVYKEALEVSKKKKNIFMYGDGAGKTVITGNKNFAVMRMTISRTATFSALGQGFVAQGITFRNTAGAEGHQAVAFRSQSDMSALFDCSIEGYQDTLYYHTYRQFYRNCVISGTIDFIFGKGTALIQNSVIIARKPLSNQFNTITADGKELAKAKGGVVLQNCRIVPDTALFSARFQLKTYLGRPWKAYATAVVMESQIGDLVSPVGWKIWDGESFEDTCICWEYKNYGPGANTSRRNRAFKQWGLIGDIRARRYTVGSWLNGNTWLPATGIPFALGFTRS
ncbi:PREDICTED: pectinesterase-like [Ipomoea nil]|uniref:pectinesterase-like n=1 Tax=Ipomoea nil TaxID=35883 RepID=UPI0009017546|nr:PREDICTED: pectinesterase-like [Ipomoea nil]